MTKTLKCISPIDGSVFAERPVASRAEADAIVDRARAAQPAWAARPLKERIDLVARGVARLGEMNAEIVQELAHMMGRPVRYGGEFGGVNERASYMASIAEKALAPLVIEDSDAFERRILREPHGVVLVIAPWNYPYLTAINTVAPALIAGNTVIIKHATQTLLVGERMVRAFTEAGVPADAFQAIFLDHETTSALIGERAFDFINFTGSVNGGREIERLIHPSSVGHASEALRRIRREGAFIAWVFFMLVAMTIAGVTTILGLLDVEFTRSVLLAVASLCNTGPLITAAAETPIDLIAQTAPVKAVLMAAMILGRLEMLAIVVMLTPDAWRDA